MSSINENLKVLRQASGKTQEQVADAISVTRQTISSYESGRTQPDLETLKRLAGVYQVDIYDVLYGDDRVQKRITFVKRAAIILVSVLFLGLLVQSAMYLIMNISCPPPGLSALNTRKALRYAAEAILNICRLVSSIGFMALLYPLITIIHVVSFKKLLLFFFGTAAAMFVIVTPFILADKVFLPGDYLFHINSCLPTIQAPFIVLLIAKGIKRRRSRRSISV